MNGASLAQAGYYGHLAAAGAYVLLALLILVYWRQYAFSGLMLAFASICSALWAAVTAYSFRAGGAFVPSAQILEILRSCAWSLLLLGLLYWITPAWRAGGAALILIIGVGAAAVSVAVRPPSSAFVISQFAISAHLVIALIGLWLVENLFRNSPRARHWAIKYTCFGVGSIFAYDFYLYSDALLFQHLSPDIYAARGVTNLLAVPLLAIYAARERLTGPRVAVSRSFVFHTATVAGAGVYLMIMAATGYYVRLYGGNWSVFLQTVFFFAAIMLLLVPLSSGSVRAYLRILVEKNFFQLKYDYRTEWLRFIKTISPSDLNESLETRVIEAIGNIVESPDGDLWLQREQGQYRLAGSWNASRWEGGGQDAVLDAASPLASFLVRTQWIVNVDEFAAAPSRYQGLEQLPKWLLANGRAWLVLPLLHRDSLLGFVVLGKPRVPRELIWEDFDLIKTVTRQAASYLAEQAAYEALTEARQFELFNKRFAFVVHDIKNLVSQLSLILSNSVRHRGNLEFQNDLLETIGGSVEKMKRMLRQLQAEPEHGSAARAVALAPLLRKVVATQNEVGFKVSLDLRVDEIAVATDEDRLKAVVEHLVQNAVEAVGRRGRVQVRLAGEGGMAVVEIEDDGPGMEPEFVREQLFRPFATTKSQGFGIGVYESRDFAQALGGGLDVSSEPGKGTIMRMRLPATARP